MFELDLNVTKIIQKIPIAKKGCYRISSWEKSREFTAAQDNLKR